MRPSYDKASLSETELVTTTNKTEGLKAGDKLESKLIRSEHATIDSKD